VPQARKKAFSLEIKGFLYIDHGHKKKQNCRIKRAETAITDILYWPSTGLLYYLGTGRLYWSGTGKLY